MSSPTPPLSCFRLLSISNQGEVTHAHDTGQIIYIRKGAMVCESASMRWMMMSNQIGWIPPRLPHSAQALGPLDGVTAYADAGQFRSLPAQVVVAVASPLISAALMRLVEDAARPWLAQQQRIAELIVEELLGFTPLPQQLPLPADHRLRALCQAILAQLDHDWQLDELAAKHAYSRSTLTRVFSRQTGLSFGRWLQQARMLAAAQLLGDGHAVSDVAAQVGYQTTSAFCLAFRKFHGVTPGTFS
jgi:AraC-like DNA-binding protein